VLYEYAAADAWPLLGVKDFADFNRRLAAGEPGIEPRLADVPVRLPLPPLAALSFPARQRLLREGAGR
jgi:phytanoyl-CoA hydroxylase